LEQATRNKEYADASYANMDQERVWQLEEVEGSFRRARVGFAMIASSGESAAVVRPGRNAALRVRERDYRRLKILRDLVVGGRRTRILGGG